MKGYRPQKGCEVLALIFFLFAFGLGCAAQTPTAPVKRVLVINEIGLSHPAPAGIMQALSLELNSQPDFRVEFFVETLDTTTFSEPGEQEQVRANIVRKYAQQKLDLIVSVGPSPLTFLLQNERTFHPNIPVVVCATSQEQAGVSKLGTRYWGSWMEFAPEKTLQVALKLFPNTKHVAIIGGASPYDKLNFDIVTNATRVYQSRLDFIYLTNLAIEDIAQRVSTLPQHSIVLFVSFYKDVSGRQFGNTAIALPLISKASNAPVFGFSDTYIGKGIVGGYLLDFSTQGGLAAKSAIPLLTGEFTEKPFTVMQGRYVFDWNSMERWGVRESQLPEGAFIRNREPSLWDRNRKTILATILLFAGLIALLAYVVVSRERLRAAKRALTKMSGHLIQAQEKERRRLASELHDDFSQRLALLSIGLEMAAEKVEESPNEAREQMHRLVNSAGELGSDLHTLSHALHSSTLHSLGLAPGIRSFCREFSAHSGVKVHFQEAPVPKSLSPDKALCLFRIVQEALRNVKKHSGATEAHVALRVEDDRVCVSVWDEGRGFDLKRAREKEGLGLYSMAERCRLQNGDINIQSGPGKGTRLDASVPIGKFEDTGSVSHTSVSVEV